MRVVIQCVFYFYETGATCLIVVFLDFLKTQRMCARTPCGYRKYEKISLYRQVTWYDYRWKGGETRVASLSPLRARVDLVKIDINILRNYGYFTDRAYNNVEKHIIYIMISVWRIFRTSRDWEKKIIQLLIFAWNASTERDLLQAPITDDTIYSSKKKVIKSDVNFSRKLTCARARACVCVFCKLIFSGN